MNIYDYTLKDLEEYFLSIGEKKFKALQVYDWLYQKRKTNFDEFSNLKKELITRLKEEFTLNDITIIKHEEDKDVSKFLFELADGEKIEAVLMNHNYGKSVCISSEVGCNMGCKFCESGRLKKRRELKPHEMVLQILLIESVLNVKITSVVIMGIGEPFDNYDNIIKFISIINEAHGLAIGSRHITVSTCGLVPKIKEFADFNLQVNLAISLHAPNDNIRNQIMPISRRYNLEELFEAIDYYIKKTNRRVTIEYVMLKGINDSPQNALELANLLKGRLVYVNLILYNETSNIGYKRTLKKDVDKFYEVLSKNCINVTVRREYGSKISAACGQLRSKYEK